MSKTNGKGNGKPKKNGKVKVAGKKGLATHWHKGFLDSLEESANVTHSCRVAGTTTKTAYEHRQVDKGFSQAWKESLDLGIARLEVEARRRAMGTEEDVFGKDGQKTGVRNLYSDTLTIFLLKAHRPDVYRERIDVNQRHSGDIELRVAGMTPAEARNAVMERLQGLLPGVN